MGKQSEDDDDYVVHPAASFRESSASRVSSSTSSSPSSSSPSHSATSDYLSIVHPPSSSSSFADDIAAATGKVPDDPAAAVAAAAATGEQQRQKISLDAETDIDDAIELPPDTIAPMPEWMYPRRMDLVPALFGRLNPLSGVLVYYTGAVLRECGGAPLVAAQWLLFVFAPSIAALAYLRLLLHRRRWTRAVARAEEKGLPKPPPQHDFLRANRPAW